MWQGQCIEKAERDYDRQKAADHRSAGSAAAVTKATICAHTKSQSGERKNVGKNRATKHSQPRFKPRTWHSSGTPAWPGPAPAAAARAFAPCARRRGCCRRQGCRWRPPRVGWSAASAACAPCAPGTAHPTSLQGGGGHIWVRDSSTVLVERCALCSYHF